MKLTIHLHLVSKLGTYGMLTFTPFRRLHGFVLCSDIEDTSLIPTQKDLSSVSDVEETWLDQGGWFSGTLQVRTSKQERRSKMWLENIIDGDHLEPRCIEEDNTKNRAYENRLRIR
jgi:hypothetical protein